MNSMYGNTITTPIGTYTIVKYNQHDFDKYMSYNYSYIGSVLKVGDRYYIKKVKSFLLHYNYVHYGVEILHMSNTIMDCVFDSANHCGVKIYYQDTYSIHLKYDDVDKDVKYIKTTMNYI